MALTNVRAVSRVIFTSKPTIAFSGKTIRRRAHLNSLVSRERKHPNQFPNMLQAYWQLELLRTTHSFLFHQIPIPAVSAEAA